MSLDIPFVVVHIVSIVICGRLQSWFKACVFRGLHGVSLATCAAELQTDALFV